MAGFMAGFGPAFAQSFNAGLERNARRKDDEFRLMYSDYMDRRKEYESQKREDAQRVKTAKALVEGSNAPQEAWTKAYEWLASGLSADEVQKRLQTGKFEVAPRPEGPSKVDTEMQAAGMERQSSVQTPPASGGGAGPQPPQQGGGNIFSKLLQKPGMNIGRRVDRNEARISQVTGRPQEEIRSVMSGGPERPGVDSSNVRFSPGDPNQGKADPINTLGEAAIELSNAQVAYETDPSPANEERYKNAQRRMDALQTVETFKANAKTTAEAGGLPPAHPAKIRLPDGSIRVTPLTRSSDGSYVDASGQPVEGQVTGLHPDELKSVQEVLKTTGEAAEKYHAEVDNFKSLLRDFSEMGQIVEQNPGVLAQRVSGIAGTLQDVVHELSVATGILSGEEAQQYQNVIKQAEQKGISAEGLSALDQIESRLDSVLGTGVTNLAEANALFNAKKQILAYRLGMLMGQEGRAFSEVEREIFEKIAAGGNSPEKFYQNLASLISGQMATLGEKARTLSDHNQAVQSHEAIWGPGPFKPVVGVEELIAESGQDDPFISRGYELLKRYAPQPAFTTGTGGNPQAPASQGGEPVPVQTPAEAAQLPVGTRFITPDGQIRVRK